MPSTSVRQNFVARARKIVVKVGTNALTDEHGRLEPTIVAQLIEQISQLMADGRQVTLVASGAIGAGIVELNLPGRPKALSMLQAAAAVEAGIRVLVTRNASDYGRIESLQILSPEVAVAALRAATGAPASTNI